jgi:hypothetical protein
MEENIDKIIEYAKYIFDEVEIVKQYAHDDISDGIKSYELGTVLIIIVSLFLCLILY